MFLNNLFSHSRMSCWWASAWLYRATDDEYFLKYVVDNAVYMGGTGWAVKEFSWDNKYAGVQILLSQVISFKNLVVIRIRTSS